MNPMLIRLRERRDALVQQNEDIFTSAASEEREDLELTESEQATVAEANDEIERLNARIADLEQIESRNAVAAAMSVATDETLQRNGVRIERVEDPAVYHRDGEFDPLHDLLAATNDSEAAERLARHRAQAVATDPFLRSSATGDLGGLVVTEFLLGEFAEIRREGRPFANICRNLPLTRFSMSIGKQTDGAIMGTPESAGPAYGENRDYANDDIETDPITVSAKTIAGYVEASVESVDFGVLDTNLVWADVVSAYSQKLDSRLFHGTGTNAQHTGVLATANIGNLSYNGAALTAADDHFRVLHSLVLQAAGQVRSAVKRAATHVVMSSLRWYSLASATDPDGRPLLGFASSNPSNVGGQFDGVFASLPVVVDDNLVSGSDDKVLVVRAPELLLWERNGGAPQTIRVDQAKATKGIVQFVGRGYSAFTAERYPDAVNVIDGLDEPVFDAPVDS